MQPVAFHSLFLRRWAEARRQLGLLDAKLSLEITSDEPHFATKRGYAICYFKSGNYCHLRFAPKILRASRSRADALIRHELGHAIDHFAPTRVLDAWARISGVPLPHTPERRADAIAQAVWGKPIRYDKDLVQSLREGTARPAHLGL